MLGAAQRGQCLRCVAAIGAGGLIDAQLDGRELRLGLVCVDRQHTLEIVRVDGREHPLDPSQVAPLDLEQ